MRNFCFWTDEKILNFEKVSAKNFFDFFFIHYYYYFIQKILKFLSFPKEIQVERCNQKKIRKNQKIKKIRKSRKRSGKVDSELIFYIIIIIKNNTGGL